MERAHRAPPGSTSINTGMYMLNAFPCPTLVITHSIVSGIPGERYALPTRCPRGVLASFAREQVCRLFANVLGSVGERLRQEIAPPRTCERRHDGQAHAGGGVLEEGILLGGERG